MTSIFIKYKRNNIVFNKYLKKYNVNLNVFKIKL